MSGVYRDRIQKKQKGYRLNKHKSHLQEIAKTQRTDYFIKPYKNIFDKNEKKKYYESVRKSEINLQNKLLFEKIQRIKVSPKSNKYWLHDRSHSLNQIVRKQSIKSIDQENLKLMQRIITQKPSYRYDQITKKSKQQLKRAQNISMIQKYKLPQIDDKSSYLIGKRSISSFDNYEQGDHYKYSKIKMNFTFDKELKNNRSPNNLKDEKSEMTDQQKSINNE